MRRTSIRLAVLVAALGLAAPAIAYICHPDPAGTRALALQGHVAGYKVKGTNVVVALRNAGTCRAFAWHSSDGTVAPAGVSCAAVAAAPRANAPANVRVIRPAATLDRPDRIALLDAGGGLARSWPLPVRVRPHTLQVAGALASYSALGGNGLWVTRLTDGRTTFVAPVRAGDRPVLDAHGVAYQDNVYKNAPASRPVVKFVPARALGRELARVGRPLHTSGAIRSFSMDGSRVALVVSGGAAGCDRVVFWNIPWRSVEQVSQKAGVTCAASGASGRISEIALGGARAQWVTRQHGRPIVVAADDIGCQEWVISRPAQRPGVSLGAIAANGATHTFALVDGARSSVGLVTGGYRGIDRYGLPGAIRAMSADGYHTAVLTSSRVDVRMLYGRSIASSAAPQATSLALRRNVVVTTTRDGRLDVFVAGTRTHTWPLPAGTQPHVDLQYGIAVVTAGNAVYAMNVATGRTAQLAVAPASPRAEIGSIGVVYAYSNAGRGTARLIPMSNVEEALR
ncbi:MAG: hypothetical protein ACJ74M_00880 [Gaiellaceae bacterium]